jgi:asparagine synthase (glutamine-hydrolysing)
MSGICGEIRFDGNAVRSASIEEMVRSQSHRGPDGSGIVIQGRLGFGHTRLKTVDLSETSQQPLSDPSLGMGIVFDGAVHNFRELRKELEGKGYRFFSRGDAEVVLKAFHAWGPRCAERFNGLFAFAIWERDSGKVTLVRDRLGLKPLYYTTAPHAFRFASHLPALLVSGDVDTEIDPVALHHYLTFHSVVPAPRTILRGVRKLAPATIMTIVEDGTLACDEYWTLSFDRSEEEERRSAREWQELVLAALRRAVDRGLVADVPVGVLLSGGLDSSLIVGLLAEAGLERMDTYSVGFEDVNEEAGDEFFYSDQIAARFGTEHHKVFADSQHLLSVLDAAIHAMSEPMVSHDAVAFHMLAHEVSKELKVVQSGQGADEVFGGYRWYPPLLESKAPLDDYAAEFFDRDHREMEEVLARDLGTGDVSRRFVSRHFSLPGAGMPVDKAMRLDTRVMMVEDPVKRVDNMSMAWGVEARVPFLDHEVVELAARIPAQHKVADGGKWVLKEAARSVIPASVIDRPKGYFPVPSLKYLQGPFLDLVTDALCGRTARERGLFRPEYVEDLCAHPLEHITPLQGSKLWQLGLLELWLQANDL